MSIQVLILKFEGPVHAAKLKHLKRGSFKESSSLHRARTTGTSTYMSLQVLAAKYHTLKMAFGTEDHPV